MFRVDQLNTHPKHQILSHKPQTAYEALVLQTRPGLVFGVLGVGCVVWCVVCGVCGVVRGVRCGVWSQGSSGWGLVAGV